MVILFDGLCRFCHWSVEFVIPRDPKSRFKFASLQSEFGKQRLTLMLPMRKADDDTLILIDGENVYDRSTAVLRILRHLKFPWPVFYVFILVPRPVRDLAYRAFARIRYRVFGRFESLAQCPVPSNEVRSRFL